MVVNTIGVVNYIYHTHKLNFIDFLVLLIKEGKIENAYCILDGIYSIGSKISSLVLRDIVHIYALEKFIKPEDYIMLQPIDTWVHQVSIAIGLIDNSKSKIYDEESSDIVSYCLKNGINPIYYNEGAWYLGSHSLEYSLNLLSVKVAQKKKRG